MSGFTPNPSVTIAGSALPTNAAQEVGNLSQLNSKITTDPNGVMRASVSETFADGYLPSYNNATFNPISLDVAGRIRASTIEQYAPLAEDNTNGVFWTQQKPLASSTNSLSVDSSAALEASSVTKAAPGRVYKVVVTNTNAATRYFQIFNSTTVPADTTVPAFAVAVPTGVTVTYDFPNGMYFSTGISWCNSSTLPTKTIGAADSWCHVYYV